MVQLYSPNDLPPAAADVRKWDEDILLGFLSTLFEHNDDKRAFTTAKIDGGAFLRMNQASFAEIKDLHLGPRIKLADLVSISLEIALRRPMVTRSHFG